MSAYSAVVSSTQGVKPQRTLITLAASVVGHPEATEIGVLVRLEYLWWAGSKGVWSNGVGSKGVGSRGLGVCGFARVHQNMGVSLYLINDIFRGPKYTRPE